MHNDDHDHDHAEEEVAAGGIDQHLWLDPENAKVFAAAIAAKLGALDPGNAEAYRANAMGFDAETDALSAEVATRLTPARGRNFIVFHDAYQYFEHRFAVPAAGSVALHDGEAPGAARVAEIRDRIGRDQVVCAFSEPQFPPKLLATLTEGTEVRTAALDPEGVALQPGEDLYPTLIRTLAEDLAECVE
jgi:zinc transport system substrate-binding protein